MENAVVAVFGNLTSVCAVLAAGYLAAHDKEGWGWFLFIAVLCTQAVRYVK